MHAKLGVCELIMLREFRNRFKNAAKIFPTTTTNVNITKLFCVLHTMVLLLQTATILE